jgi:mono/diheme cytochrome c family protein
MLRRVKRSTLVIFGLVAVLCAVLIPAWAISRDGSEGSAPQSVEPSQEEGKELFVTNCGSCHTLYKAGTDGVVGPNLDEILAPPGPTLPEASTVQPRVLSAIDAGVDGKMPADILSGEQAEKVAQFVAEVAGRR